MKKSLLLTVFLLIAAQAFPQERRTRSENANAGSRKEKAAPQQNSTQTSNSRTSREVRSTAPSQERQSVSRTGTTRSTTERAAPAPVSRSRTEIQTRSATNSRQPAANPAPTQTPARNIQSRSVQTNRNSQVVVRNEKHVHVVKSPVVVRETRVVHHHHYQYRPIEYRRVHYRYRAPVMVNVFWTRNIYYDFVAFYPHHRYYVNLNYEMGRPIHTISAYDAMFNIGRIHKVYGEVSEVHYSKYDDIFYLYIGGPYPYHDFTIMIEGNDYRRYRFPNFNRLVGAHVWSMGLITEFEGKPEVLVRRPYQFGVY
jgi:hypothetical protein